MKNLQEVYVLKGKGGRSKTFLPKAYNCVIPSLKFVINLAGVAAPEALLNICFL